MKVKVYPSKVNGAIKPPSSKSISHRAIICASLSKGKSIISNVDVSDDIIATVNAFKNLGVKFNIFNKTIEVESKGISHLQQEKMIDCNESGSTIRFLIPLMSNAYKTQFKGKSSLLKRPFTIYEDIFNNQNLVFKQNDNYIETVGRLKPANYSIPGDISSQFISGLLFTLPLLDRNSTIEITGKFESKQYVDITIKVLDHFGITIEKTEKGFFIKGNQKYHASNISIDSDYSQAAFYAVLGCINNDIEIQDLNLESLQPDKRILEFINLMNGSFETKGSNVLIHKSNTTGAIIDVSQCPDIAPITSLLAALSKGKTHIINAKRLVIKESNRLLATHKILNALGVKVFMNEDSLKIVGTDIIKGTEVDSFNDHRIAMTLSIAATVASGPITILRAEAINKSYPRFYKDLEQLGVQIEYITE